MLKLSIDNFLQNIQYTSMSYYKILCSHLKLKKSQQFSYLFRKTINELQMY